MPSVIGTLVTANYLKAQASTQFGTRQLSVLTITKEGITSGEGDSDSLYSKIIRALQQTVFIFPFAFDVPLHQQVWIKVTQNNRILDIFPGMCK